MYVVEIFLGLIVMCVIFRLGDLIFKPSGYASPDPAMRPIPVVVVEERREELIYEEPDMYLEPSPYQDDRWPDGIIEV